MESATVTIKDVINKGNGWYEVSLVDDERVLSTKKSQLAELAMATVGGPVQVEFNERKKGRFTDRYLESINGEKGDTRSDASKPIPVKESFASGRASGKSDAVQEKISTQWAFGRATELLIASDRDFSFPLDAETQADLKLQAQALLEAIK